MPTMSTAAIKTAVPIIKLIDEDCRQLLSNRATLPSMPEIAMQIRREMQNQNWSIRSIAAIVKRDPGTTTQILKVANSALYGGASKITDIEQGIVRIGIDSTRSLVTAHTLRSMFVTPSTMLRSVMHRTWTRSARLASVSAVLARIAGQVSAERAMLAGMLQDIGVLPILNVINRHHEQIRDEAPVNHAIDRYAGVIGTILLTNWGFDDDVVGVAKSRGNWLRDSGTAADLADLVLVARLHAGIVWGDDPDLPGLSEIPAFQKLPLGELCEDGSIRALRDQTGAIDDILSALGA